MGESILMRSLRIIWICLFFCFISAPLKGEPSAEDKSIYQVYIEFALVGLYFGLESQDPHGEAWLGDALMDSFIGKHINSVTHIDCDLYRDFLVKKEMRIANHRDDIKSVMHFYFKFWPISKINQGIINEYEVRFWIDNDNVIHTVGISQYIKSIE